MSHQTVDLADPPTAGRPGLVAAATGAAAVLREQAAGSDRARRLTGPAFAALEGSGMLRLMTPSRFGGHATDLSTFLAACTELGRGCCSAAWIAGVLGAGDFVVSLFPEQAQEEVWGDDPDAGSALVLGAPGRDVRAVEGGGAVVSGRWPYASGSCHTQWVTVLVAVPAPSGPPVVHFALVPRREVTVEDTWTVVGMRGTGSNTVVMDGVVVPPHRLLPYHPVLAGDTDGLVDPGHRYRNSLTGVFSIGLIGALLGGAREALDIVQSHGPTRRVAGSSYTRQTESPTFQLDLAEAAMAVDTATLHARRLAETVDTFAAAGENPDLVTRARARMDSTLVAHTCRGAVDTLLTAYGSAAFDEAHPLQRIWRDVNVGSRHAGFGMGIPEQIYGRALVGEDPRRISPLV